MGDATEEMVAEHVAELLRQAEQRIEVAQQQHEVMKGGLLTCACPCHMTIEQGGGQLGGCVHCRVLG